MSESEFPSKRSVFGVFTFGGFMVLIAAIVVGIVGVGFAYVELFVRSDLGPRQAAVERKIFQNTPQFLIGKEQELSKLRLDYNQASDPGIKANIAAMAVNQAAGVDVTEFADQTLAGWVNDMRSSK